MAKPPVCKIMDYGKYKYETKKRANEAKKKQVVVKVKEIKLRPRTDEHDFEVRVRQAREFLEEGHKVKVTIVFRGREIVHREVGQKQLQDMMADLKDVASIEQSPRMEGRSMFMLLGSAKKPSSAPAAGRSAAAPPAGAPAGGPAGSTSRPPFRGPSYRPAPVISTKPAPVFSAPTSGQPAGGGEGGDKQG